MLVALVAIIGFCLFLFRCCARYVYGLCEIIFACVIAWRLLNEFGNGGIGPWLTFVTTAYLVVRGFDNMRESQYDAILEALARRRWLPEAFAQNPFLRGAFKRKTPAPK